MVKTKIETTNHDMSPDFHSKSSCFNQHFSEITFFISLANLFNKALDRIVQYVSTDKEWEPTNPTYKNYTIILIINTSSLVFSCN